MFPSLNAASLYKHGAAKHSTQSVQLVKELHHLLSGDILSAFSVLTFKKQSHFKRKGLGEKVAQQCIGASVPTPEMLYCSLPVIISPMNCVAHGVREIYGHLLNLQGHGK